MDIPAGLLPTSFLWGSALLYILILAVALLSAPWSKLADNEASHVYFAAVAVVCLLWTLHAGIAPGHNYHLLGVTSLCLMFDWQFALLAVSLALLVTTWQGPAGWEAFALNALVMGALPVLSTRILLYASQRLLTHNFFIYIFVNAFFAGALGILLCGLAAAAVLALAHWDAVNQTDGDYLLFIPLLMFGEAFLNGMTMTLLVVYRPRWVSTFHDHWYLDGK
jgi:uncharacterized membrane protein